MQYLFYALLSLKVMLLSNIVPKSLIVFNFSKIYIPCLGHVKILGMTTQYFVSFLLSMR